MGARRHKLDVERRGQAGIALAETLIAVAITSIWVLAIVIGLLVVTTADASSSSRQRIVTALAATTESLKEEPYLGCGSLPVPTVASYTAAVAASPDGYQPPERVIVTITRVEFWDGDAGAFVAACPSTDGGAQRLSIEAVESSGQRGTAQVVKAAP